MRLSIKELIEALEKVADKDEKFDFHDRTLEKIVEGKFQDQKSRKMIYPCWAVLNKDQPPSIHFSMPNVSEKAWGATLIVFLPLREKKVSEYDLIRTFKKKGYMDHQISAFMDNVFEENPDEEKP